MYPRLYKKLAVKNIEPMMISGVGADEASRKVFSTNIPTKKRQARYKDSSRHPSVEGSSKERPASNYDSSIMVPERQGNRARPVSAFHSQSTLPKMAVAVKSRFKQEPDGDRAILKGKAPSGMSTHNKNPDLAEVASQSSIAESSKKKIRRRQPERVNSSLFPQ